MLGHRLRRWPNIKPTLGDWVIVCRVEKLAAVCTPLAQCRASAPLSTGHATPHRQPRPPGSSPGSLVTSRLATRRHPHSTARPPVPPWRRHPGSRLTIIPGQKSLQITMGCHHSAAMLAQARDIPCTPSLPEDALIDFYRFNGYEKKTLFKIIVYLLNYKIFVNSVDMPRNFNTF